MRGDVGWHLRLDDADLRGTLVAVVDGGETVAVGILDGSSFRSTVKPTRLQDRVVADALVSVVVEGPPADIADRVHVQIAAFDRSTFTVGRWRRHSPEPAQAG